MRNVNPTERAFLEKLIAAASVRPVRLERALEQMFFTERLGRALIIQPIDRFGYFYLKPDVYDNEQQRQIETNILMNLFSLIVYLREQGLIVIHSDKKENCVKIRCLSDGFRSPTINGPGILLNERGDYTLNPGFIHDPANNVIYRGVRLDGDLYDLVADNISGFVYVSSSLPSVIDPPALQDPPSRLYDDYLSLKLSMLLLGCAMAWLIWQGRSFESSLSKAAVDCRLEQEGPPHSAGGLADGRLQNMAALTALRQFRCPRRAAGFRRVRGRQRRPLSVTGWHADSA